MSPAALLLAPGAGADRTSPQLVAIDGAVAALGLVVRRMDFPYRLAGRRAPDRAPVLVAAVRAAAAALAADVGCDPGQVVLGGRSMGGRMCSMAVAEGLPCAGLVLVSYPLHPPGRPEKQADRTAHLPSLGVPCLFLSGDRDPFGGPEELAAALLAVPGPVRHEVLPGDHGLRRADARVAQIVADFVSSLPSSPAG